MNDATHARQVKLIVTYNKKDISKDLQKYLIGFTYTDNASNQADDIDISLEDKEGLWHGDWLPRKGDLIHAYFYVENWNGRKNKEMLPCGTFTIDDFEMSGPPDIVSLKGQSVPIKSSIKYTKKSKAWKNVNLSKIVQDIAGLSNLKCMFECCYDPFYKTLNQIKQADLSFLKGLCNKNGISLKLTDNQIVLFDEEKYEQNPVVTKIKKGKSNVISYFFSSSSDDTAYGSCRVRYLEAKTNKVITHIEKVSDGPQLEINEQVHSKAEATRLAKKKLREKNKKELTASLSMLGDIRLVAGITVELIGWKRFDGKYMIQKATHTVIGGYKTEIELTKCLEGY